MMTRMRKPSKKMLGILLTLSAIAPLLIVLGGQGTADRPQQLLDRAVADFRSGRIAESAAGFDTLAKLVPEIAPELWQRGIVLYYAGRYPDCRAQFESHRTVNPNDVENAAWHFLCVAKSESFTRARVALLPVGPDSRVPMAQIYEMFRGDRKPEDVLGAAGNSPGAQFYAELYVGLYYEAAGNEQQAMQHMRNAASERYASAGGYMHIVAQVHSTLRQR